MLQLFEPTPQLMAALILGSCTLAAAIVNAIAQLRVARAAKRKGSTPPKRAGRVRGWVILSAAFALVLAIGATSAREVAGDGIRAGAASVGNEVAALVAPGSQHVMRAREEQVTEPTGDFSGEPLVVASLVLRSALSDSAALVLLDYYELRLYALDLRLPERPEAWQRVPVGMAPAQVVAQAREQAARRARGEACAFETVMAAVSQEAKRDSTARQPDTMALRLIGSRAATARDDAIRLSGGEPAIHGMRVVGSSSAARAAAADTAVEQAVVAEHDPGWVVADGPQPESDRCTGERAAGASSG